MKNKIIFAISGLAAILTAFWVINTNAVKSSDNNSKLTLAVSSDKDTYVLGEIINLQFELKSETGEAITLRIVPTVENGYMQVWIASAADREFKEYQGYRWGLDELNLPPQQGKSFKSKAAVLWNNKPPAEWKGAVFAKDLLETDYVALEPGVYFIKASASVSEGPVSSGDRTIIESEPIRIVINEPAGDDLRIWKKIKDRGDIGYFIQVGDFRTSDAAEREKLRKEVEDLIAKHPNSILAGQIRQSLEKFQVLEELIKESSPKNKTTRKSNQ